MHHLMRKNSGVSSKYHLQMHTVKNVLDKITQGKVDASVKAIRTALKKLEDGGSVEDAKAVCEPQMLHQIMIWKNSKFILHLFSMDLDIHHSVAISQRSRSLRRLLIGFIGMCKVVTW